MPKGDGTGPMGMGRMSGRGAGVCAGFNNCGIGSGMGYGRRNGVYAAGMQGRRQMQKTMPIVDSKEVLQRQAELLQNQLNAVNKRLAESV